MSEHIHSSGIVTTGHGVTNMNGPTAVGDQATINITGQSPRAAARSQGKPGADIGVITILTEEARAVREALDLHPVQRNGLSFDTGTVNASQRSFTVAAAQTLDQGEGAAVSAFSHLRDAFTPRVVALVGIAGGIHPDVHLADVVIATRVTCYDVRKETFERVIRRGKERQAPAGIGYAVNRFFTDHGEPAIIASRDTKAPPGHFRVVKGPLGSGNAVIAQHDSHIVRYLHAYNDKILAVDMESDGFSQAFHDLPQSEQPSGWLVIRGISDHADAEKNDDYHGIAAANAATTLLALLPYLIAPEE